jgi:hypothetical protein
MAKSKKSARRSNPRQNFFGMTKSSEPRGQFTVKGTVGGRRFISNEMTFARTVALLGEITAMSTSEVKALVRQADKHGQEAIVDVRSGDNLTIARAAVRANPFGLFRDRLAALDGVKFVISGRIQTRMYDYDIKGDALRPKTAKQAVLDLVADAKVSKSEAEEIILHAANVGEDIIHTSEGSYFRITAVKSNPRKNLFGLFSSRLDSLKGVRFHVGGRESDRRGALPLRLYAVDARTAMRTVEELVGLDQRDAEDVVLEAAKFGRASVDNPVTGGVVSVVAAD